ncbi:MAG: flagellin [Acidimicrobiaceae bacterium]|nr:flagellin [Acidimicrobiaceae bacterium]
MTLSVNTNIPAIDAYNNLNNTSNAMNNTVSELSSGLRIQTAANDASGYVIAQGLDVQSNGLGQAVQNGQNAISVLQIAEGAMNQQVSILQRMNQIATQAANGGATNSNAYTALTDEMNALANQLQQIATSTSFGGTNLLDGSYSNQTFQIGAYTNAGVDNFTLTIQSTEVTTLNLTTSFSITNSASALSAMQSVQNAIQTVASTQASVGASQNQIQAVISNDTVSQQNVQSAYSTLVDANMAQVMTSYSSQQVLMQAGVAMLGQAQQLPQMILKLIP